MYSDYGIAFDVGGSWNFCNGFARNVIIFDVDNASSTHADNHKNIFFALGQGPTFGVNRSFSSPEKKSSINFTKAKTTFPRICITTVIIIIYFLMEKKILNLKADNNNVKLPTKFCLESISNGLDATESSRSIFKGNFYNFSVDYNVIGKCDILSIHNVMAKNNVK